MGAKQRIYTAGVLYYTVLKIRTDFQKGRQEDVMERNDPRYQAYVEILKEGSAYAEKTAAATLAEVRKSMRIDYFDNDNLLK